MSHSKVIDADGHIIERSDELRRYLKAPFNKRGGPLTASEPWDRDLQETLPRAPADLSQRAHARRTGCVSWIIRHRAGVSLSDIAWATCRASASLTMLWHFARLTTTTSTITT